MIALSQEFFSKEESFQYLSETIDIAALWTVADCMPLIDENRIIVVEWLKQIKNSRSRWMKKLIEDKIQDDLDADIFSFLIWPKLNAAGRLDSATKAVNLILNNSDKIDEIILDIENINNKRKELTKIFTLDAMDKIDTKNNVLFYQSPLIDHGIIWIVAWRLTEKFHKPSIVLKDEWEKLVASCRSPEYFSMVEYLEKYTTYFLHFGWHKQAAWFSILKNKFEDFRQAFTQELNSLDFSNEKKVIFVDKILAVEQFWFHLSDTLKKFKPYGIGNIKPIFMFQDFDIEKVEYIGKTFEHITLKNRYWLTLLWFWWWEYFSQLQWVQKVDILFDLMEDMWMWKRQLKAKIIDICLL
jgi:single-stranded-DNA-specific exonuclease